MEAITERIDRPVFVIGVDHSGTSILYRMLARHPDFAWLSQYSLRDGTIPGRRRVPFNSVINRVGRRLTTFGWRKNTSPWWKNPVTKILRPQPREGTGTWRRLIPRTREFLDASDCTDEMAERIRRAVATELDAWRLERMLVKIPYLTRCVLLVDRIFPDALFIHIVRDGKAVALSNRGRLREEADGRRPEDALLTGAGQWVETLRYLERCEEKLGGRFHTVRYEEFCTDVHDGLARCFRFCGLDPGAAELTDVPRTLEPTNPERFRSASTSDRVLLNGALGATLDRWGYDRFEIADATRERAGPP